MPEMLSLSFYHCREGQGDKAVFDRRSGGTMAWVVGTHVPEAQDGGPIAYLRTGDITVDQDTKEISMAVSDEELAQGRTTIPPLYSRGVLAICPYGNPLPLKVLLQTSGNQKKLVRIAYRYQRNPLVF